MPLSTQSLKRLLKIFLSSSFCLLGITKIRAEPFLWGVANSAFQVEGSPVDSDWREWTRQGKKIVDGSNGERAAEFWRRYPEDINWAQKLGANAFRFSMAWERIVPREGEWNAAALEHYGKMIVEMRRRGLEPVLSLQHFALPLWLAKKGGLIARNFPDLFSDYAFKVIEKFSKAPYSLRYVITFNEPMVMIHQGYLRGEWPPGEKNNAVATIEAVANIARAHVFTAKRIREGGIDVQLSVAKHWRHFESAGGWINQWASKLSDWVFNDQLMSALSTGRFFFWMPGSSLIREEHPLPGGRSSLDFVGINYYGRMLTKFVMKAPYIEILEGPGPKTDLGWEIFPEGLNLSLRDVWSRYRLPIMVTENGLADAKDSQRNAFIRDHVAAIKDAQGAGVPVLGYLHWSLTDNFEWALGLEPRFGLIEIDYATQQRRPRPSFFDYQEIIRRERASATKSR